MRAYRSSEAGLRAFLLWAETHDMTPMEEMLRVGVERGWFTPEEIDVDEVAHLRAVVALNREEAAGAQRRIDALDAALRALVDNGKDIEPVFWDGDGDARCCYCGNYPELLWGHEPDCPVVKARALLQVADAP